MYNKDPRKNCFEMKRSAETVWVCVCVHMLWTESEHTVCVIN